MDDVEYVDQTRPARRERLLQLIEGHIIFILLDSSSAMANTKVIYRTTELELGEQNSAAEVFSQGVIVFIVLISYRLRVEFLGRHWIWG